MTGERNENGTFAAKFLDSANWDWSGNIPGLSRGQFFMSC